ncbi:MAG: outer membrane beta-barrel protein [Bacteroidetes bacterium]|jgi:hypothetical protein|nr:outer membrane beta-barrel protein [Bacteroidota bacterium]
MKNLKLLIVILITAQLGYAQEIDFGAKLGVNFATLNDVSEADNKTGFVGGAFLSAKFSKIGLQAELLYSQQGAEIDATEFDLNYVNIPVLFKFYLIGGLNVQAGPQFGFLIDDSLEDSVSSGVEAETFDLSGAAGLGFDLPAGLRADARYVFGLTDTFDGGDGKNGVFMLSLGYSFL